MGLGVGLYIIPLGMIANPELIALAEAPGMALLSFLKLALGLWLISFGLIGTPGYFLRAALIFAGTGIIFGRLLLV
jgi:hypothetical protein